ncbi:hypothetical protein AAF712_014410 [Marasmius tenuissimus]|uniref:F-box domain-containing protein n=1 Tax=Marasmius tenuissimus TaxID=585030 RepID=A0ABR2ZEL0_9AGAR
MAIRARPPQNETDNAYDCSEPTFSSILAHPYVPLDMLRQNDRLPTDAERAQERRRLEREEVVLDDLDDLLENGSDVKYRDAIEIERVKLLKRMEHRRSWIAPFRRLPVEILEEIFYRVCCAKNPSGYALLVSGTEDVQVSVGPALRLGLVCYRWRAVAHSSARLWDSMSINITDVTPRVRKMVDFYLSMVFERPLERLAIVDSERGTLSTDGEVDYTIEHLGALLDGSHVLATLLRHANRAKELHLRIHPAVMDSIPPLSPRFNFPNLLSFSDQSNADAIIQYGSTLWRRIGNAPNLRSAHIQSMSSIYSIVLPFARLTSFTVDDICIEALLEILPRCAVLQKLRVNHLEGSIYPLVFTDRITVPSISNFHIRTCAPLNGLCGILSFLTLPSLAELSIASPYDHEDRASGESPLAWTVALTTMLQRSKCILYTLTLDIPYTPNISVSTVPDLLHSFPNLRSLDVGISGEALHPQESPRFAIELLRRLIPNPKNRDNILVPKLTSLTVREPLILLKDQTKEVLDRAIDSRSEERLRDSGLGEVVSSLELVFFEFSNT